METCPHCQPTHSLGTSCPIPDSLAYVTSYYGFMSHWGASKGRVNLCVVPCAHAETGAIATYLRSRSECSNVRVTYRKPRARGRLVSVLPGWRERALESKGGK